MPPEITTSFAAHLLVRRLGFGLIVVIRTGFSPMTKTQQIARVRHVLKTLRHSVEEEYLRCAIRSEADVQAVVVQHLKQELRQHDDHWIIGANFSLGEYRPDGS